MQVLGELEFDARLPELDGARRLRRRLVQLDGPVGVPAVVLERELRRARLRALLGARDRRLAVLDDRCRVFKPETQVEEEGE